MILDIFVSRALTGITNMVEADIVKVLGVNKEIKVFQERLETIKGYLQQIEQKRHINDIWVRKLKEVMYDADDVIDRCMIEGGELKAQALSDASTVSIPFNCLCSCFQCFEYRRDIANQIVALNTKLEELKKDIPIKQYLGQTIKEEIENVDMGSAHETSPLQVEGDIVGTQIENATEVLISLILENNPKKCRVFGVVGTGGIGKSTLASKILEDERIKDNFPNRIWLYVSQNYTEADLLKKLIRLIRSEEESETKGESLKGKSKVELEDKLVSVLTRNTFIVLDDVWKSSVWTNFLRKPIMKSSGSCTVLVTSRIEEEVMLMRPAHTHQVEKMDQESGWSLLKHLVFEGVGDEDEISSFEEIGNKLVNKCDGLPLAIKAVAGVLYKQNKAKWEEVLDSDTWNMDKIQRELIPLYLSYEDLNPILKRCFLYCSLYPQKDMNYKEIVQFWAAEGLITGEEHETRRDLPRERLGRMEDSGEEIYRKLICKNLLEANVDFDLSMGHFSMHDHFRSLCANLMREEGILYRHGREFKADDNVKIRRLSVSHMGPKLELPDQIIRQACLRTLILTDSPKTKMIQDSVLRALPYLRVLDLTKTSIEKIPDCIGDLVHLRYLDLDGTKIREIPTTIGNLVNLQSLNISDCDFLESLPVSITKLHNLRWLDMRDSPLLTHVPRGIGKLENFYSLLGFMVGQNDSASEEGCDLEELKNLSNLRDLKIYRLERAEGGASALANKPFLKELTLVWMQPDEEGEEEEEDDNGGSDEAKSNEDADGDGNDDGSSQQNQSEEAEEDENEEAESENEQKRWSEEQISKAERICNEMSQPSSTIFDIVFYQYPGRQLPSWMTSSSLFESFSSLTYLRLSLPCCTALPPLGTLLQLKYLSIESASAITVIGSEFLGSRNSAFPKLEVLKFIDLPQWEEWTFNGTPLAVKLFPSLTYCGIFNCPNLRALPDGLHQATKLNELCLRRTHKLCEINNLPLSSWLVVSNGRGLKKISNIPPLRYLEVDDCPDLECVKDLGKLQHLVSICSEGTEQLPQWLPGLIEQHNNEASTKSLRKFEMQCNLQLLKSCLKGHEYWDIIKQIPDVKVRTFSGKEYIRYTKDPYNYDAKIPPN